MPKRDLISSTVGAWSSASSGLSRASSARSSSSRCAPAAGGRPAAPSAPCAGGTAFQCRLLPATSDRVRATAPRSGVARQPTRSTCPTSHGSFVRFHGGVRRRQRQVERGGAAHLAAVGLVVERPGAMHGAAIVPDHEIMRPPDVAIEELRLRGMVGQVAQQQPALRHRPVDDMGRVRGEIEGAAAGARVVRTSGWTAPFSLSFSSSLKSKPSTWRE